MKKKKTTASGKLVLIKSVRRHWTSGGCPFSADRSGTETAQSQNEILCSRGLAGIIPNLLQVIILIYLYFDILFDTLSEVLVLHP